MGGIYHLSRAQFSSFFADKIFHFPLHSPSPYTTCSLSASTLLLLSFYAAKYRLAVHFLFYFKKFTKLIFFLSINTHVFKMLSTIFLFFILFLTFELSFRLFISKICFHLFKIIFNFDSIDREVWKKPNILLTRIYFGINSTY